MRSLLSLLTGSLSRVTQLISEGKRLQLRLDALIVFNHPVPADPTLDINSTTTPFGNIATKTGTRQFQALMRLQF
jgi:hypothetical protein